MNKLVNIFSNGDPNNPKTWSGTPFNLVKNFSKSKAIGLALDWRDGINSIIIFIVILLSYFYYFGSKDISRGKPLRQLYANNISRIIKKYFIKNILYMGTLSLPYKTKNGANHFLFCDSTWNLWSKYSTDMKGYSKLMLKHAETLEKESYHQMDHIFSISTYVRDNLISHYEVDPKKITVVGTGLGIIEPYFGPKNYNNGKIIFVAKGRFSDKGGPLVLEAFKLAQMVNPSLELCIVGQSEYEGIEDISNLKTYGFISIDALQQLFNEASLFLMPATNEPWGLVYLEALACKIPIVGLNMNGFPEISRNGEYGYILNDYSPSALSQVILDAFSSPKNLESMGLNGQNYCLKNFSWDHTASKIINVINSY